MDLSGVQKQHLVECLLVQALQEYRNQNQNPRAFLMRVSRAHVCRCSGFQEDQADFSGERNKNCQYLKEKDRLGAADS